MLPNRSLLVTPTSGFVPFAPAGALDAEVLDDAPVVHAPRRPAPAPVALEPRVETRPVEAPRAGMRSAVWQPRSTFAVRRVEMGVLAALCGYFAFGLVRVLGLF